RLAASPTLTLGATVQGMILGTAAYMAPEQAKGVAVDKRADIWAFGVVLWEMLTGRRLFAGDSVPETLAGVLEREIDLDSLPETTPPAIRRLLRRCLERRPRNRLHDIADARIVLDELVAGRSEEDGATAAAPVSGVAPRRSGAALTVAAAVALCVGLGAGWLLRRPEPPPLGAGARWALAIPEGLTLSIEQVPQIALSDDGRLQLAVVLDAKGESQLLLRSIDEAAPRLVPDTEGALAPFFSPDGAWIGFFREHALFKIPTAGGTAVQIAAISGQANQIRGASWSRDGFIYFAPNVQHPISRISADGGAAEEVTKLDVARDERTHRWPQALPDGRSVLYTSDTTASTEFYDDARVEAVVVATGERRVLVEGSSQARCCAGGRLVFARGGALFAVPFDVETLAVTGSPEPVVRQVATDVSSGAVQFALSPSGAALWVPGGLLAQYELHWIARDGSAAPVSLPPAQYNESVLSPDGRRVALVGGPGGGTELWVAELERGLVSKLTSGDSVSNPVWTPDGSRVVYRIRASGAQNRRERIAWRTADGSRDAEILYESGQLALPSGITPDGSRLLFSEPKASGLASDVYFLPFAGARTPTLFLGGEADERDAVISPDGRFVAYSSNESGALNVYVRPFPAGEGRWQISPGNGAEPRWGPDMKELYYRRASDIMRVPIETHGGFRARKPEPAVDRVSVAAGFHTYSIAADGRILTLRSPNPLDGARIVHLDLGFARRLAARADGRR
ncbi:MAG TPA: protein kinase, partial [Thermoanaerobaculia bacterium]|nr:protein kinase [Thermoanaerobaculia bacterium]